MTTRREIFTFIVPVIAIPAAAILCGKLDLAVDWLAGLAVLGSGESKMLRFLEPAASLLTPYRFIAFVVLVGFHQIY